ncbi:MAG: hypothetical protein MUC56_13835 [Thermoanaerobaculales bacterium]|jgi:hypothetical protein|nr:hypothetical protein [Thermoanaerobaculales bacterium]
MAEPETHHCPNCSAPVPVPLGETEVLCEYCDSQLRFIPGAEELEVVKTREEMKLRERIAVEQQILRNRLHREEMDRWRETAAKVAIAAVPIVGRTAGRALFAGAARRGSGCGCLAVLAGLLAAALALL